MGNVQRPTPNVQLSAARRGQNERRGSWRSTVMLNVRRAELEVGRSGCECDRRKRPTSNAERSTFSGASGPERAARVVAFNGAAERSKFRVGSWTFPRNATEENVQRPTLNLQLERTGPAL